MFTNHKYLDQSMNCNFVYPDLISRVHTDDPFTQNGKESSAPYLEKGQNKLPQPCHISKAQRAHIPSHKQEKVKKPGTRRKGEPRCQSPRMRRAHITHIQAPSPVAHQAPISMPRPALQPSPSSQHAVSSPPSCHRTCQRVNFHAPRSLPTKHRPQQPRFQAGRRNSWRRR